MHLERDVLLMCGIGGGYCFYWILRVSLILWLFIGYKVKEGEHIRDWLFYQQYHFASACSQGRNRFVIYDGERNFRMV